MSGDQPQLRRDMAGEWSEWVNVSDWLNSGWNAGPEAPWAKGVYRFRVTAGSPREGEVTYIGRAGRYGERINNAICARLASFITAAMGFWSPHAGGETFYRSSGDEGHGLSVRDLEVSWAVDDDPECREAEELLRLPKLPMCNKEAGRTCKREECDRAKKIVTEN
jgi:hypothetical protein